MVVVVSGYQVIDAAQAGNTQGLVFSGADVIVGVAAFVPGFDVAALGYFGTRIADDIATAGTRTPPLLERSVQYDSAGCQ